MTREEAVEKLEAFAPMVVDDTREALEMAIDALRAEPVKHGEWENRGNRWFTCSLCDWECVFHYNYCPQCGAKMDKE